MIKMTAEEMVNRVKQILGSWVEEVEVGGSQAPNSILFSGPGDATGFEEASRKLQAAGIPHSLFDDPTIEVGIPPLTVGHVNALANTWWYNNPKLQEGFQMEKKQFNSVAEAFEDSEKRRKKESEVKQFGGDFDLGDILYALESEGESVEKMIAGMNMDESKKRDLEEYAYQVRFAIDAPHNYETSLPFYAMTELSRGLNAPISSLFPQGYRAIKQLGQACQQL